MLSRTFFIRTLLKILLFGLLIGPWPAARRPDPAPMLVRLAGSGWDSFPGKESLGPVRVGVAEVDLVPPDPLPLAGFIGQIVQPAVAIQTRCRGKALTIAGKTSSVTLLAVDLLLIDARLASAVLTRTGLARDQIYFTATHTHSGPGGWGNHPLERLVAGTFEPEWFDLLAGRLAEVVLTSRARLEPAEVAYVQTAAPGLQQNRIIPGGPTNDALSAWIFRSVDRGHPPKVLATFATFGAHATITHPIPPRLGGDYPAAFAATLPKLVDAGMVLFAAGTVGDASPIRPQAATAQKSAEAYGSTLAKTLAARFETAEFHREIELRNWWLPVQVPWVQVPFLTASLQFSPAFTWWIGRPRTHLHAVRLGPAVLIGFPGDYAGHLGMTLRASLPVIATSFNGDYKGYLVARSTFRDYPCYETRWMSFHGADLGDQLTILAQQCLDRICKN